MQTPVIVTFANQKGGVGKTSLCVAFANYLAVKGVRVAVVDCDGQRCIMDLRSADISKYGKENTQYEVYDLSLADHNVVLSTVATLHNDPTHEVVVIDAPGSTMSKGLFALFMNSDIIVIPFHYDNITISSTAKFILLIDELRNRRTNKSDSRVFMIPNLDVKREGTKTERELWERTRDAFSIYGVVTPKISFRSVFKRYSTIACLDKQFDQTKHVFGIIYKEIFGSLQNRRNNTLTGINLDPERQKKKRKPKDNQEPENDSQLTDNDK